MTRGIIPAPELEEAVRCAADALLQSWPADPVPPRLAQALRDCTISLRECSGDLLWAPETHPVLLQAGQSLDSDEISGPGLAYWQEMLETSTRVLGPDHSQAFRCRDGLASAYEAAGRLDDAIGVHERTLAERQRILGKDHPDTLASCGHLARAYAAAGRHGEALPMYERVVADREWVLGATAPGHTGRARRPGRRLPGRGPARPRPPGVPADPGGPGAGAGPRAPGHAGRAGRAGPGLPHGRAAQAGRAGLRADPRGPGKGAGPGPPGHASAPAPTWPTPTGPPGG